MKKPLLALAALAVIIGGAWFASSRGFLPLPTAPAEPVTPKKVGILQYVASLDEVNAGFKEGMQALGWKEGETIFYEYQNSSGDVAKAKQIAAEYIAKDVDLMFVMSTSATKAALDATKEAGNPIPIVYGQANVSVEIGNIKSYESSGNNVTGVENVNATYIEREMDFLKRMNPKAARVGIFALVPPFQQLVTKDAIATVERLAPKFDLEVKRYDVAVKPGPESKAAIQKLVDGIKPGEIDAFIQLSDPATNFQDTPAIFIRAQERLKIPMLTTVVPHVKDGALLSYGSDFRAQGRQAAALVDKVLRGKAPSDIPIEFSKKTVIALNLDTARKIGLTVPASILSIADVKVGQ